MSRRQVLSGGAVANRWAVVLIAVFALVACRAASAQSSTHAPWPADWNNWSDPALWVTVGNPGNAPDMQYFWYENYPTPVGSVSYSFRMGKFDVTAGQYTVFLNAVAKSDPYGLYKAPMGDPALYARSCNIRRTGSPGAYSYSVAPDWANRPVNVVTWGSAARFANWLTNGQPATGVEDLATTEDGSYYLNGVTTNDQLMAVTRKPTARYVLPTQDEWYKAAFHKNDGVTGNYWDYPTCSNSAPSNVLTDPDPGNSANFQAPGYTIGAPYFRTEVGEFENSAGPYGTFDMGGNVRQWMETVASSLAGYRWVGGGGFQWWTEQLGADYPDSAHPASDDPTLGFRVAEVPEPSTLGVLAVGGLALLRRRSQSRSVGNRPELR